MGSKHVSVARHRAHRARFLSDYLRDKANGSRNGQGPRMPTPRYRSPYLERSPTSGPSAFLPVPLLCALRLARAGSKMESPMTEDKLNARRKAVVLNGFPLLALSFQTLGMLSPFIPASHCPAVLRHVQALSTPILVQSALSPFHDASSSTDIYPNPVSSLRAQWHLVNRPIR